MTCVELLYSLCLGPLFGLFIMAEHSKCSKEVLLVDNISILRYEIEDTKKRPKEAYLPKQTIFFKCNFVSRPLIANRFPHVNERKNTNKRMICKKRKRSLI